MQEGHTVTNAAGGKQSFLPARFDLVPPVNARLVAEGLGFGAAKYGENNWQDIPLEDNVNHAIAHLYRWLEGDRSEPHLVNAIMRGHFALWHAVELGMQPPEYNHPEREQVFGGKKTQKLLEFHESEEERIWNNTLADPACVMPSDSVFRNMAGNYEDFGVEPPQVAFDEDEEYLTVSVKLRKEDIDETTAVNISFADPVVVDSPLG